MTVMAGFPPANLPTRALRLKTYLKLTGKSTWINGALTGEPNKTGDPAGNGVAGQQSMLLGTKIRQL